MYDNLISFQITTRKEMIEKPEQPQIMFDPCITTQTMYDRVKHYSFRDHHAPVPHQLYDIKKPPTFVRGS
jgi:hypothetical protein